MNEQHIGEPTGRHLHVVRGEVQVASGVTRRQFLELAGGTALAFTLVGCTRALGPTTTTLPALGTTSLAESTTTTLPPLTDALSVWREVLAAVRTSPDHLAARAEALIAARDPEAIFALVRDGIRTLPPSEFGFSHALSAVRWGTDAALRCGAGTPREKAELLAGLLQRAGFDATVIQGALDPARAGDLLVAAPSLPFSPVVDDGRVDQWLSRLGADPDPSFTRFDEDRVLSAPLAETILDRLPSGISATPFDASIDLVPLVQLTVGGLTKYANPLVANAEFGEPYASQLNVAPPPNTPGNVEVALQVAFSIDPADRRTVAEASWPLTAVVGRRIVARFVPEGDAEANLLTAADQVRTFSSVLMVDGPHLASDESEALTVLGSTVTIGGDLIVASEEGLTVNGASFGAEPGVEDRITTLEVAVSADAFPLIRLRVSATDGNGAPVLGAPADAFVIEEDGGQRAFTLRQTRPPVPKVLLLVDTSGSIPPDFIGEPLAEFGRALVAAVHAEYPSAEFRVAGLALGTAATAHFWTTDPDEVALEAGRAVGYGSEFWAGAGDAAHLGANVIVLVTDGQSTDLEEDVALARPQIAAGPPVVSILVGEPMWDAPRAIAELSGGAVYQAADRVEAVEGILGHLRIRDLQPLEFQYEASMEGTRTRSVLLRTSGASTTASYEVPTPSERLEPPSVSGIYLVVRADGREVVRTLAGVHADEATSQTVVDPATRLEVRGALFGSAMISVEGGAPTFSAWLDDILTARLTWEPVLKAAATGDRQHVIDAIVSGFKQVPSELMLLHAPLEDPSTFELSPRMVMLARRPTWDGSDISRADILPFTRFASATTDPVAAFRTTVEQTARLAAIERHLYADSTASRLEGRVTEYLDRAGVASREGPLAPWARLIESYSLSHRLLPTDAERFAFWTVSDEGTVIGVLPDGSGGGITPKQAEDACKTINQGAAVSDIAGGWLGLPGAYGAFIALQKAIIKQYLKQAARISAIGEGPLPDVPGCGGASDFPCDVGKDALLGAIPGGRLIGGFDKVVAAATGDDAFSC